MNLDVIGDIHGQYDKLVELLAQLGYRMHAGACSDGAGRPSCRRRISSG